jgi:hypothetical protein
VVAVVVRLVVVVFVAFGVQVGVVLMLERLEWFHLL